MIWATFTRPKNLGGLGIPDLEKFGRALRLRGFWQEWVDDTKPWVGLDTPTDDTDRALFTASIRVVVGDGHKCRFWPSPTTFVEAVKSARSVSFVGVSMPTHGLVSSTHGLVS